MSEAMSLDAEKGVGQENELLTDTTESARKIVGFNVCCIKFSPNQPQFPERELFFSRQKWIEEELTFFFPSKIVVSRCHYPTIEYFSFLSRQYRRCGSGAGIVYFLDPFLPHVLFFYVFFLTSNLL